MTEEELRQKLHDGFLSAEGSWFCPADAKPVICAQRIFWATADEPTMLALLRLVNQQLLGDKS